VMMEHASSREEVLSFLGDLKDALAAFTAGLERYAGATAQLDDRHPGLALDHGLAVYRASLRWTRHAIAALRAAPAPPRSRRLGSRGSRLGRHSQLRILPRETAQGRTMIRPLT